MPRPKRLMPRDPRDPNTYWETPGGVVGTLKGYTPTPGLTGPKFPGVDFGASPSKQTHYNVPKKFRHLTTKNQGGKRRQQIKGNIKPKLPIGRQLRSRVESGAITGKQAQRTAAERQTFQKAYGKDWRTEVFGKGGARSLSRDVAKDKRAEALAAARRRTGSVSRASRSSMPRNPQIQQFGLGPVKKPKRRYL